MGELVARTGLKNVTGSNYAIGIIPFDAVVAPTGGDYTTLGAAVIAGKKRIWVWPGTYIETGDITLTDNTLIFASGNTESCVIDLMDVSNTYSLFMANNCYIMGLKIKGKVQDVASEKCIDINSKSNICFDMCHFQVGNTAEPSNIIHFLKTTSSKNIKFLNCKITIPTVQTLNLKYIDISGATESSVDGLAIAGGEAAIGNKYVVILGVSNYGNNIQSEILLKEYAISSSTGSQLSNVYNMSISANGSQITNCNAYNITVSTNSYIDNCIASNGLDVYGAGCRISNCNIANLGGSAAADNLIISGSTIGGFNISSGSDRIIFNGCYISNSTWGALGSTNVEFNGCRMPDAFSLSTLNDFQFNGCNWVGTFTVNSTGHNFVGCRGAITFAVTATGCICSGHKGTLTDSTVGDLVAAANRT